MTLPGANNTPTLPAAYPAVVIWNWDNHHADAVKVEAFDRNAPGLQSALDKARAQYGDLSARLEKLYGHIADLEKQQAGNSAARAAAASNAEVSLELVMGWCNAHSRPLPAKPAEIPLEPTGQFPPVQISQACRTGKHEACQEHMGGFPMDGSCQCPDCVGEPADLDQTAVIPATEAGEQRG